MTTTPVEHFTLNGLSIDAEGVLSGRIVPRSASERAALDFLRAWYGSSNGIELHSSGSTGAPKLFVASRDAMRAGARLSNRFFGLGPTSTALLPLPIDYIAGKMMMVRALVGGFHLRVVEPDSHIIARLDAALGPGGRCDFAPLVPMQINRALEEPQGLAALARIGCVLIGGGFIDPSVEKCLQAAPCRVCASYGMTETLSHIALRDINGTERSSWYKPLPGVSVSLSDEGSLVLRVPHLGIERLETNDLAELQADGRFRILGRRDAVINSGGIKIQPESIEKQLNTATGLSVLIVGTPHPLLGECVTLLLETVPDREQEASLERACASLEHHLRPRRRLYLSAFPRTSSGKIARAKARMIACAQLRGGDPCSPPQARS